MYWFGKFLKNSERPWENEDEWAQLELLKKTTLAIQVQKIIDVLDKFSLLWHKDSPVFQKAINLIQKESSFSTEEIKTTLEVLPKLLSKIQLEARLEAEFKPVSQLDKFSKVHGFTGEVRAFPLGTLLHVTAGNVFLSSLDSLIMGLLTKNLNIIKVSSQNTLFPLFFAEELSKFDEDQIVSNKFAIVHWKGGDTSIEELLKKKINGIVAWGGEEMIASYSKNLPLDVKLIKFGPKISLQVITRASLKNKSLNEVAKKIVQDILPWDQSACSSPQNLYIQDGIDKDELINCLQISFEELSSKSDLTDDQAVERLKEIYRAQYSELMEEGRCVHGENYLIHLEKDKFLRPSPLNRSLIIKSFDDAKDLYDHVKPFSYYLQSCSFLFDTSERDEYFEYLALAGIKRFAPLGTVTFGMNGAPHDGVFVMRELTKFMALEDRIVQYGEPASSLNDAQTLKKEFERIIPKQGYLFSSGGTTGEPKYSHFNFEEFDHITDMLAFNLKLQGVKSGMKVANLFVAGNLWSSFIAMDRALEKIGAIILPIGGLCPEENILAYLSKFNPDVIMGIPSLLIKNAELSEKKQIHLRIPKLFYAGEGLSKNRREYLRKIWSVESFGSAGYASVDAGVIGYQCSECQAGEHHVFSDLVDLKIIDGEAFVTSLYRKTLPVINYKTGDKVEWLENTCKVSDRKFKLLGRTDNLIQIWSSRINLEDIILSLESIYHEVKTFQVNLFEDFQERMEILVEDVDVQKVENLKKEIYKNSRDLKDTLTLQEFSEVLTIKIVESGKIKRNSRTGKITLIQDFRH